MPFYLSHSYAEGVQVCPQVCIRSQVPQTSHSIYCIAGDAGTVLYQSPVTQVRHIASDYRLVKNLHPRAETVYENRLRLHVTLGARDVGLYSVSLFYS